MPNFPNAVILTISPVTSRNTVPDGTDSDCLSSEITLYAVTNRNTSLGVEGNVTDDKLNSMSKQSIVHNSQRVHQNTNSHRPTEHVNIIPQKSWERWLNGS